MTNALGSAKTYVKIWVWLAGLMLVSVVLAEAGLAMPARIVAAVVLVLSLVKAVLVALYYMHLKTDRRLLAMVLAAPFLLVLLALGVIFSSTLLHF